jgi:hypothetical protein
MKGVRFAISVRQVGLPIFSHRSTRRSTDKNCCIVNSQRVHEGLITTGSPKDFSACRAVDITPLDHIAVSPYGHLSLKNKGLFQ